LIVLLHLFLMIVIANGAPIMARKVLGESATISIDGNRVFFDERPIFGASKTWWGLIASVVLTGLFSLLLGYEVFIGVYVALAAMLGDLMSSFIKRRLDMPPSSMAPLLDQIPESLFPILLMKPYFDLHAQDIVLVVTSFIIFELLLSKWLFQIGLRKRPY